jgi:hypothetical protein
MPPKEYFKEAKLKIKKRVEKKYGPGPYSKEEKKKMRKECKDKYWQKIRARGHYEFRKIRFENNRVRLRIDGYSIKGVSFLPSKLIRHFKPEEIRRAAAKYLKLKERYHL